VRVSPRGQKQNSGPYSARGVNPSSSKVIIGNCEIKSMLL
jgi:hypothetical protein